MASTFSSGATRGDYTEALWQAVEQIQASVEKRFSSRVSRGEVRTAILALLSEEPMHGYQIIREIEERSHGSWKPSAGSVYPTLQLLADEGIISVKESNGRKTYSLTKEGQAEAEAAAASAPWQSTEAGSNPWSARAALPKAGVELAQAAAQVGRSGSPVQIEEAVHVLDEARRKLYAILAQS